MRIVLIVFCWVVTLVAAAAAILLLAFGDQVPPGLATPALLALIPGGVAVLNVAVLVRQLRGGPELSRGLTGLAIFDAAALFAFGFL